MQEPIFGAMSALITPFKNNRIDFASYEKIIQRQIRHQMDATLAVGTTGESATLSHDEHKECIEAAVAACKNSGVKVLAGAGSNATNEAIDLARFAQKAGVDAILCVAPYYNKPTQEGLFLHFEAIAKSVQIPVMLYNIPGRTNVTIEIPTILRLKNACQNIIAIKEASGNIERVVEINAKMPDFLIFSGEDSINFPILASGGCGVISVTGNLLPDKIAALTHAANRGDFSTSRAINAELFDLNKALFCETNPIPIKTAMWLSGLIDALEFRLPLTKMSTANLKILEKTLEKYEVQK